MAAYAADLAHFPLWAIDAGCMAVIGGKTDGSKAFAPSSLELRDACAKAIEPVRQEIAEIGSVLDAEVYHEPTVAEREKIHAEFRKLVEDLKLNVDPRDKAQKGAFRVLTRDEAQAALDRAAAAKRPLPQMSSELREKMGLEPAASTEAAE